MHLSDAAFRALVEEALAAIPASIQERIDSVAILVEDDVDQQLRAEMDLGDDDLLGLFQGLTRGEERSGGSHLPPVITLYRIPILSECDTPEEALQEIKDTLWHEIAHYLGLDEDEVRREEARS